jgi:hypothetical protein
MPCSQRVSIQKWHFSAISASICGIVCAVYNLYTSAQSLDFLDLAKNCSFLNWKLELVPIGADFYFWMGSSVDPHGIQRALLPYLRTRSARDLKGRIRIGQRCGKPVGCLFRANRDATDGLREMMCRISAAWPPHIPSE